MITSWTRQLLRRLNEKVSPVGKAFQRLSLDKKSVMVIVSCVILSMAILSTLIVRRETFHLESDSLETAGILTTAITTAVKNNMLSGHTDDSLRLIRELSTLKGVQELSILKADGGPAFNLPHAAVELDISAKEKLWEGRTVIRSAKDAQYVMVPLMNESRCRSCHLDNKPLRGIVMVKLSTSEISRNVLSLAMGMAAFGVTVTALLSALLIFFNRRIHRQIQRLSALRSIDLAISSSHDVRITSVFLSEKLCVN